MLKIFPFSTTTFSGLKPRYENDSTSPSFACMEYFPSKSVFVPLLVFSTIIFTPGSGVPDSSVTVPETDCCAIATTPKRKNNDVKIRLNLVFIYSLNLILTSLLFLFGVVAFAQQSISGTVTDESGVPLPGATITIKDSSVGTTSDFDGNFTVNAENGDTLVFGYVGYSEAELVVDGSTVNISLSPSGSLDEVVVTALGVTRDKKSLGYAVHCV
jgi:hypothetical protein